MSAEEKYDEYGRLISSGNDNELSYKIGVGLLSDIKNKNVNNISIYELNKTSNAGVFIYDTKFGEEDELLNKRIVVKDLNGSIIWKARMVKAISAVESVDGEKYSNIYISEKALNISTLKQEDMICTICLDGLEDNIKILEVIKDKSLDEVKNNNVSIPQNSQPNVKMNQPIQGEKKSTTAKIVTPGMQKSNEAPIRNERTQGPGMQRGNERVSGVQDRGNEQVRTSHVQSPGMQKPNNEQSRNQRMMTPGMQRGNERVQAQTQMQRKTKNNENIKSEERKMQEASISNVTGTKESVKNALVMQTLKYVNTQINVYSSSEIQNQMLDCDIIIEKIRNKYVVLIKNLSLKPMYLLDQYNKFFEFDGNINDFIEKVKEIMIKMYRFTEEEFEALRIVVINDDNYGMNNISRGNVIRRIDLLKQIKDKYIIVDFINSNPIVIINEDVRTEIKLALMNNYDFKNFCLQMRSNIGGDLVLYDEKIFDEEQNCLLDILI